MTSTGEQPMSGEVEAARQDALYAADHARPAAVDALIAAVRADEQERERALDVSEAVGNDLLEATAALEASRQEVEALRAVAREVTEHFEDTEVDCEDCRLTRLMDGDDPCAMHACLADLRRALALATEEGASE